MNLRNRFANKDVAFALCSTALACPLAGLQTEWTLAVPSVIEFGLHEDAPLHRVTGAVILTNGSLVIADHGNHRLLQVSRQGEMVRTLGRKGSGPGEFQSITALFATDTTVLAYDGMQARVTVWNLNGTHATYRLPTVRGRPTKLVAVVSASRWILTADEASEIEESGLVTRMTTILTYDPTEGRATGVDVRPTAYSYIVRRGAGNSRGTTWFGMSVLGSAHVAAGAGRWFFVPVDRSVLEIRDATGTGAPTEMHLPIERGPYSVRELRAARDKLTSVSSDAHARLLRQVYADVEGHLPPARPPARRVLTLGNHLWIERFEAGAGGSSVWLVIDPNEPRVLATAVIEPGITLLGGSETAAAVLTRTELGEEVVSVRSIVRSLGKPGGSFWLRF